MFGSIATKPRARSGENSSSFLGPGYLVAVGYMDPGNWATSLAGGSKFGYALLTVALLSNLMAILLQALCARLGIGAGRDLAQACRDAFPRVVSWPLWVLAEIAICATDLAEVIGTAIGLNLLFGIPLEIGVLITALDVFLILWMQNLGFRWIEAFIVTLLGVIAVCFIVQIAMADPEWGAVIRGFAPTTEIVRNPEMLYLASASRRHGDAAQSLSALRRGADAALRRFHRRPARGHHSGDGGFHHRPDVALLINAAILILAAATFNKAGKTDVAELDQVHSLLAPMLGSAIAPTLFGIALLCCGLNSTVTATLSGQIVMEGFIDIRLPAWARRLVTRSIAIVPAAIVTIWYGEAGTAKLLILSQVVLVPATAVRHRAAGDVHRRPPQDGRADRAAMGDGAGGADRGRHHRAEHQAALRSRVCRELIPDIQSSSDPQVETGECSGCVSHKLCELGAINDTAGAGGDRVVRPDRERPCHLQERSCDGGTVWFAWRVGEFVRPEDLRLRHSDCW